MNTDTFRCRKCNVEKAHSEFGRDPHYRSGHQPYCKECRRAYAQAHAETIRERADKWNTEHRERYREIKRNFYANHKEECLAQSKEYRNIHYEDICKPIKQKYYERNKDKFFAAIHKRRARIHGNGGSFTPQEWQVLCDQYDNRCLCCGEKKKLTVDHVIPISKGGSNSIDNIQPLCRSCNAKKYNKIIDYR
jgi:5-methylcytosine-specific restriction endonuclease McrA